MKAIVLIPKGLIHRRPLLYLFMLVYLLLGGLVANGAAQIIEGDVELSSQAAVDSFSATYISGSLTIRGDDIVDLTSLATLDSLGGALNIFSNTILTNLDGLNNLTSIAGDLLLGQGGGGAVAS